MSGRKAKELRREIYGDMSIKTREYVLDLNRQARRDGVTSMIRNHPASLRAQYQAAKRRV